jgi:hypothetical protein
MMARKVVPLREGDGGDDGDSDKKTITAIPDRDFKSLHKKVKTAESGMKSEQGTISQLISDAVSNNHLHKGAYGIFRRLDKMDDYKLSELLFHFDLYRERAKWDTSDLFERSNEAAE